MYELVFFIDVDNTLIYNDQVKENLNQHLQAEIGDTLTRRFWEIYEQVRVEQSVVNIPVTLQRLRAETPESQMETQTYQHIRSIFDNYPFTQDLYPQVLETLRYLRTLGLTVIVSDGDQYFQAEKIVNSHLADAVEGRVLIYIHKQQHLAEIQQHYPAEHYAMIDDKLQILADSKAILGKTLTTVFVKQGKYAQDQIHTNFSPTISVEHIGDLQNFSKEQFLQS
jgi:FMN phosphatase YigB (HAD superfamily)